MVLDIYVMANPSPSKLPNTFWITFEEETKANGGYYFFLYPPNQTLYEKTGQCLSFYNNALFCGKDLEALSEFVTDAERLVESQPDIWEVHIGTQTGPGDFVKEIYSSVEKTKFQMRLRMLAEIIAKAQELNGCVICVRN